MLLVVSSIATPVSNSTEILRTVLLTFFAVLYLLLHDDESHRKIQQLNPVKTQNQCLHIKEKHGFLE